MGPKNYDENSFLVPIHLKITRVFVVGKNSDVVTTTTQTWAAVAHIFFRRDVDSDEFYDERKYRVPARPLAPGLRVARICSPSSNHFNDASSSYGLAALTPLARVRSE